MEQQSFFKFESPSDASEKKVHATAPLAYQLAPRSFETYVGQKHVVGEGKPLRELLKQEALGSLIFWGPPGVGKTALARLISYQTQAVFISINAVLSKVQDIRDAIEQGRINQTKGQRTILFIDEIHRFNKAQQDALLPDLERGSIQLIGATTENPHFSVNPSILSRAKTFELHPLDEEDLNQLLTQSLQHPKLQGLSDCDPIILKQALRQAQGDGRRLVSLLEGLSALKHASGNLSLQQAQAWMQNEGTVYRDDEHYDIISAFIKSMRGSDIHAALYWLARMLVAGENPRFIARRMLIFASEDIGNADPHAITLAASVLQTVQFIGMPEAKFALSQATIYLARAPKSNEATTAILKAMSYVHEGNIHPVPMALRDAHYKGAKDTGRGVGYKYPHDYPHAQVEQRYWDGTVEFCSGAQTG